MIWVLVPIFGILWLSGALKELVKKLPGAASADTRELLQEVAKLREEVRSLRDENSSRVLDLDNTLDRVEYRLQRLETGGAKTAQEPERTTIGAGY